MKLVSQLDADGYLVGPAFADPSPREDDVFLLPGGCVDAEPPQPVPGTRARWVDAAWVMEALPVEVPPDPRDTFAADLQQLLLEFRAQRDVVLGRCTGIEQEFAYYQSRQKVLVDIGRIPTQQDVNDIEDAVATVRAVQKGATSHPTVLAAAAARDAKAVDLALRTLWADCSNGLPLIAKVAFSKVDK